MLRKAKESEVRTVASLYAEAIGTDGCTWNGYYPTVSEALSDYKNGKLFVYFMENEIVGAVSIVDPNELDELECWENNNKQHCEIARAVVKNSKRGQNLSEKMLNELFAFLKNEKIETVRLLVAICNEAAKKTYRKLGFKFLSIINMYSNDYYVCELDLRRLSSLHKAEST